MRYFKTEKQFKTKRCEFNPHTMEAWSYSWWKFVECRDGVVYLNMASYSMQTTQQQWIVRTLLKELGVKFRQVYVRAGLHNIKGQIEVLQFENKELSDKINNPKTQIRANIWRAERIQHNLKEIVKLKALNKKKVTTYKGKLNFEGLTPPTKLTPQQLERRRENKKRRMLARATSINSNLHPSWLSVR